MLYLADLAIDPYSRLRREVLVVALEDILVVLEDALVLDALVLDRLALDTLVLDAPIVLIVLIAFYVAFSAFLVALSSLYFYFIVYT